MPAREPSIAQPPDPDLADRAERRRGSVAGSSVAAWLVEPHALFILVLLAAVWTWWAWKQGAYFSTVFLPGAMLLCVGAIVVALTAPLRTRASLSWPARAAAIALPALAAWTLLSALWSPAPDIAVTDGQRVFTYALAFALGFWLCNLLGRRVELALAPLAIAGGLVAVATTVTLLVGHDLHTYLNIDGTLQYPLGYRNANAAFFLIAVWPALGLATRSDGDWRIRGLALGAATLCLELGLLCQSRASAFAGVAAVFVYLLAAPRRAHALLWLCLAALPALLVVPHLSALFHSAATPQPHLETVRSAAQAAAVGAAIAVAVGAVAARVAAVATVPRRAESLLDRSIVGGMVLALVGAIAAFVIVVGNPATWIGHKFAQFNSGENLRVLARQPTRFGFNTSTGRSDFWHIALHEAGKHPLLGDGAGGYRYAYLRQRDTLTTVRDAHSVEFETLSELGVPGLALLVVAIGGAGLGIIRARRAGPAAASLAAAALAAGTYWLIHASTDWFWPYPAVTAPVICLAGAACSPALRAAASKGRRAGRRLFAIAAGGLALSIIPPFLSARYLNAAFGEWRANLPRAFSDLDAARTWNPLSEDPLLATGAIARAAGDRNRAVAAFRSAAAKRPEDWAPYYYLATMHASSAPRLARQEVGRALRLDPAEPVLLSLQRRLTSGG